MTAAVIQTSLLHQHAGLRRHRGKLLVIGTVLFLLAIAGVIAYRQQFIHGESVTGMRTIGQGGAAWGAYIVFVIYFINLSFAGVTIAALIRLFGITDLMSLSRLAELLTLVTLAMGACCVIADLGRPVQGLLFLPQYAKPSSPFFGTFSLVVSELFASLVFFYLSGRSDARACKLNARRFKWFYGLWASGYRGTNRQRHRHRETSFWLSLMVVPLLVTATSTLGFVFGIQAGRPGWFSALQAPGFVVIAALSGTGALIVFAGLARSFFRLQEEIPPRAFAWLGNFAWILTLVYLYFIGVEELTASYTSLRMERHVAQVKVWGTYAPIFWSTVTMFVVPMLILFIQFLRRKVSIGWTVTAGVLINVAAILRRYLIVVPSQTDGTLLPYVQGAYAPSLVECLVVLGLMAIGALGVLFFAMVFPFVPRADESQTVAKPPPGGRGVLRVTLACATLICGLTFSLVGFLCSLRYGTEPFLDPILAYSPVVFIVGIMLVFMSAAVYEALPALTKRGREEEEEEFREEQTKLPEMQPQRKSKPEELSPSASP